jgi:DNA-binding XRE family transcriptional regulator
LGKTFFPGSLIFRFLGHVVSYTYAFSCVAHSCRWTKCKANTRLARMQSDRTLHALSKRIKDLRLARGISQEELAHRSGLSRTGMGFLETGKRWPRLDTLVRVAEGLNITVDELLKGVHKSKRRT